MDTKLRVRSRHAWLGFALFLASSTSQAEVTLVPGTDLMGGDYKGFALDAASPETCRQACADDAKCKSFTYVNPGVKGPAAMCYLKDSVPASTANACCTSGKKSGAIKIAPTPPGPPAPSPGKDAGNTPIILGKLLVPAAKPAVLVNLPPGLVFTLKGDMTGWTPLTNGAPKGGVSVVKLKNGEGRVIVRAGDGDLYVAPINLLNPGTLDTAAWIALGRSPRSEPHCQPNVSTQDPFSDFACVYLGKNGSVTLSTITANTSGNRSYLGGQNAGSRPTLVPDFSETNYLKKGFEHSYEVLARDGGLGAFRLKINGMVSQDDLYKSVPAKNYDNEDPSDWQKMSAAMATPIDCARDSLCAVGTGSDQVMTFALAHQPLSEIRKDLGSFVSPGKVPSGLSTDIAPALVQLSKRNEVFVRGKNGHIYRWRLSNKPADAQWQDMGGDAMAGSSITCRANNEQPMCFIQATDGKIYWRKFDSQVAL